MGKILSHKKQKTGYDFQDSLFYIQYRSIAFSSPNKRLFPFPKKMNISLVRYMNHDLHVFVFSFLRGSKSPSARKPGPLYIVQYFLDSRIIRMKITSKKTNKNSYIQETCSTSEHKFRKSH